MSKRKSKLFTGKVVIQSNNTAVGKLKKIAAKYGWTNGYTPDESTFDVDSFSKECVQLLDDPAFRRAFAKQSNGITEYNYAGGVCDMAWGAFQTRNMTIVSDTNYTMVTFKAPHAVTI